MEQKATLRLPQWSDEAEGSPRACSTAVSIVQQHYNPDREVVLRSEFLPERQFRVTDVACSLTLSLNLTHSRDRSCSTTWLDSVLSINRAVIAVLLLPVTSDSTRMAPVAAHAAYRDWHWGLD